MNRPLRSLSFYKDLHDARGRRESGCFLVEGERFVAQLAEVDPSRINEILIVEGTRSNLASTTDFPVRILTAQQYAAISPNKSPQPVSAVVSLPEKWASELLPSNPGNRILFLEDVQDPGNVGTLLRSAAGFGFSGAILSDKCADPFSPRAVAASAGAVLSLWIRRTAQWTLLTDAFNVRGLQLFAADMDGVDVASVNVPGGFILAMGNEGNGLSSLLRQKADALVAVPFCADRVESLNVGAAGAVCMYALTRGHS